MTESQRTAFLARVGLAVNAEDFRIIEGMSYALPKIIALLEQEPMTLKKLRHLIFGPKTEKTRDVCPPVTPPVTPPATPPAAVPKTGKPKGHGRIKASAYTGARREKVSHPHLKANQECPGCKAGKLRLTKTPGMVMRIVGSPPLSATVWELEKLRCDTCGKVHTAPPPPEAGQEKYGPSAGVTVAILRYGSGMPHYRLARLQESLGVPCPESTQWEVMKPLYESAKPILEHLIAQTANSPLFHNDDTKMRVLDLRRPGSATAANIDPKRKGTFTSSILGQVGPHTVALYFTGWQHAGENLADVLKQRRADLDAPMQMCDALSSNFSPDFKTLLGHCLSHGRREFVPLAENFPQECQQVLEALGKVYHVDAQAKERSLQPGERLLLHQSESRPVMEELKGWMQDQLDGKKVEPNSGLGRAIGYLLKHWEPLTLFLRKEGAPLDNNICERALKMAILHRKNSLSYKTDRGAKTGDLFMSLIQTCRLNGFNPSEYLLAIATNPQAVKLVPQAWLPWNYPRMTAEQAAAARR
jgi:transposase